MAFTLIGNTYDIDLIGKLIMVYISFFIVELINKIGHIPKKITFEKIFPIPKAIAWNATYRYGGMIAYALIFVAVWHFQPEIILLQLIGFVAWLMFISHSILGVINVDIPIPRKLIKYVVTEEIPNEYWYIFIPLAFITFAYFYSYYLNIITLFLGIVG